MRRCCHPRRMGIVLLALAALAAATSVNAVVGDVTFKRMTKGDEDFPPAIFSHWLHRVKFKCYVCHNKTVGFEMKAGASASVTMATIDSGKYCGACHKGQPAFGVSFETCSRCHRK
ncbi:MAG: cytochrome c3 family protein [Burkholderiaceae bacterium]|nr:cytochrome c3 family protein [Burkholderiaceae bacterium]